LNKKANVSGTDSKAKKVFTGIGKVSKTIGKGIAKVAIKTGNFLISDDEEAYNEEQALAKKSFAERFFSCIVPRNIYGLIILYFLLQDFVFDGFIYNFDYNSSLLRLHHIWACVIISIILFMKWSSNRRSDSDDSLLTFMLGMARYLFLVFGIGLFIEFVALPHLRNLSYLAFTMRVSESLVQSKNLDIIFSRALKPYWTFIALIVFGRFTRFRKSVIFFVVVMFLITNIGVIDSGIRSTVSIAASTKYYTTGTKEAALVFEQIKANLKYISPVTWLQNYLNQLGREFGDEHIDGEYANNAGVSGVIFRNPYSSNPLSVFENNNPKSDANVIVEYVRNPQNDCIINGICDSDNKLTIQCCVDNIKFLAKNSPAESPSNSGLCSEYKSYSVSDLAYSQSLHSCYIEATDTGKSLLDTEERVRVNITGNYTFQTVGNKDFRFAEKSLIVRCRTNQQYSISSLNCLGFAGDIISSESSSGPITIGIGTPKDFNEEVLTIDNQLNESEQQILPLLISVSNKGDGVIKSINNLYLAIPKDMDLSKYHYCNFEKVNNKNPNCYSAFGSGISSNPLNPNGLNDKYDCYEYSFEQEYTQQKVLSQIQTGSIYCSITPKKEILDGNKATKNIKVFFNYTYEISKNIDITFKNTGSKSNPTETITSSPSPQTPCEDGTQIGECSTNQAGFKCLVNEDGVSQLVPSCPVCSCVNGKVCHPSSKVCIDEKYENIVENVCTCTDEGVVEEECPEGYTAFCRKLVYSPGYQCLCEESQAT